jgi:hypothetical protein
VQISLYGLRRAAVSGDTESPSPVKWRRTSRQPELSAVKEFGPTFDTLRQYHRSNIFGGVEGMVLTEPMHQIGRSVRLGRGCVKFLPFRATERWALRNRFGDPGSL